MKNSLFFFFCTGLFISTILISCRSKNKADLLKDKFAAREKLAAQYCGSCHLPPDPSLLDKETWTDRVLPAMAKQLGLEVWQNKQYYQNENSAIAYPDWMEIIAFYDSLAPSQLPLPEKPTEAVQGWANFTLKNQRKINLKLPQQR